MADEVVPNRAAEPFSATLRAMAMWACGVMTACGSWELGISRSKQADLDALPPPVIVPLTAGGDTTRTDVTFSRGGGHNVTLVLDPVPAESAAALARAHGGSVPVSLYWEAYQGDSLIASGAAEELLLSDRQLLDVRAQPVYAERSGGAVQMRAAFTSAAPLLASLHPRLEIEPGRRRIQRDRLMSSSTASRRVGVILLAVGVPGLLVLLVMRRRA